MKATPAALDCGDGIVLSALVAEPEGPPRATIVALHGAGMRAGYFDGRSHPDISLLTLGARLGYTVVAVDRPGYGRSGKRLPNGQSLTDQRTTLHAGLTRLVAGTDTGAGLFLLAHSFGGKLALACAAEPLPAPLLGLDVSGCGHRYAADPVGLGEDHPREWLRHWGRLRFYPPGTFRDMTGLVTPPPALDLAEAARWPDTFDELAARVRVPLRLTFAEYEQWWRHDPESLADLASRFRAAPRVVVEKLADSGHNISLGLTARSYHLRALAFLEECLLAHAAESAGRPPRIGAAAP
ncbi:alpha/beta hydrolase [Streptomyces rubiginosohelvolus]|uniref:alpha/beta hydrolase n=1 Tax=Streptomyces rubiginosohelvolus TaxID=67362 RepID=UPI0036DAC8B2